MELGIEKYAMMIKRNRKRHMTERIELPNQEKIGKLRRKETCKYLRILKADTIKQVEMKENIKISRERENYSKPNYIAEISSKG